MFCNFTATNKKTVKIKEAVMNLSFIQVHKKEGVSCYLSEQDTGPGFINELTPVVFLRWNTNCTDGMECVPPEAR